jgi:hypothetical protein
MTRSSAPAEGEATIKEQTAARIDSDNHDRCYLKSLGVSVGIVLVTEGALTARMASTPTVRSRIGSTPAATLTKKRTRTDVSSLQPR